MLKSVALSYGAISDLEKKYLTTLPTYGMMVSIEHIFYGYGARAAARAQEGTSHEVSLFPARSHPGAFHLEEVCHFASRFAPYI